MVPNFPSFKKVSLEDESSIKFYTNKHKPYSDFNFTSLWSWDVNEQRLFSDLNGNLVVCFTDYESNEPFLSFLGTNKVLETAITLIDYSKSQGLPEMLDLVAEESVGEISPGSKLLVEPSVGNTDYIFDVARLSFLQGRDFKSKRNLSRNFLANNKNIVFKTIPYSINSIWENFFSLIRNWEGNKIKESKKYTISQEELSIRKLLNATKNNDNLLVSTLSIDGEIIAFSLDELLVNNYAISHFIKADISYKGIYEFMNEKIAEHLHQRGVLYWNWEQDLGLQNIRLNKLSYRPVDFLKKYKITLNNS